MDYGGRPEPECGSQAWRNVDRKQGPGRAFQPEGDASRQRDSPESTGNHLKALWAESTLPNLREDLWSKRILEAYLLTCAAFSPPVLLTGPPGCPKR